MRRRPELDGLRGVAIAYVVVYHYLYSAADSTASFSWIAQALIRYGFIGLDVFFALSGFLIGGILFDNIGSPRLYRAFYARRAARILPVYVLFLGLFFVRGFRPAGPHQAAVGWYAAMLQNFSTWMIGSARWAIPAWSVAVEEQFYAFAPIAIRRLPRVALLRCLWVLVTVLPIARFLTFGTRGFDVLHALPFDALAAGVICADLVRRPGFSIRRSVANAAVPLCLLMAIAAASLEFALGGSERYLRTIGDVSGAAIGALLVLTAWCARESAAARILRAAPLVWLGGISYFVYLFHWPAFHAFEDLPWQKAWRLLFCAAVTVALGAASRRVLELPVLKLGHRIKYGATVPSSSGA